MEDFDYWDDDPFGEDKAYSDGKFVIVITAILLVTFLLAVFTPWYDSENVNQTENIEHNELATVYDSPSSVLVEHEERCPECGNASIAVNDEIVCRNEGCPNYGIAVTIDY